MLRDFVCFRKFELNVIQMSKLDLERKDIRFRRECIEINDSYAFWQAYCPQLAPFASFCLTVSRLNSPKISSPPAFFRPLGGENLDLLGKSAFSFDLQ